MVRQRTIFKLGIAVGAGTLALVVGLIGGTSANAAGGGCQNANTALSNLSQGEAQKAVTCLINGERSASNLSIDSDLTSAARKHTNTMRRKDCFSHRCPGEDGFIKRVKKSGYSSSPAAGEAIQVNQDDASPRQIVRKWINSDPHRALLRSSRYEDIGFAFDAGSTSVLMTAVVGSK